MHSNIPILSSVGIHATTWPIDALHFFTVFALRLSLFNADLFEENVSAVVYRARIAFSGASIVTEGVELGRLDGFGSLGSMVLRVKVPQELCLCDAWLSEIRVDLPADLVAGVVDLDPVVFLACALSKSPRVCGNENGLRVG